MIEPAYLEATFDLVVLDPMFKAPMEVFDPETGSTKTYWVGVGHASAGDDGDDKHTAPLPSFSPPFRSRPVDKLNHVLVAMALHEKFKAYTFEGVELAPQCLPYKEGISRLVSALNYKLPPPPRINYNTIEYQTIPRPLIESDDELHSCHSSSSNEQ